MTAIFLLQDKYNGKFRQKDHGYMTSFSNAVWFTTEAAAKDAALKNEIVKVVAGDTQLITGE